MRPKRAAEKMRKTCRLLLPSSFLLSCLLECCQAEIDNEAVGQRRQKCWECTPIPASMAFMRVVRQGLMPRFFYKPQHDRRSSRGNKATGGLKERGPCPNLFAELLIEERGTAKCEWPTPKLKLLFIVSSSKDSLQSQEGFPATAFDASLTQCRPWPQ